MALGPPTDRIRDDTGEVMIMVNITATYWQVRVSKEIKWGGSGALIKYTQTGEQSHSKLSLKSLAAFKKLHYCQLIVSTNFMFSDKYIQVYTKLTLNIADRKSVNQDTENSYCQQQQM